jgi:hypothetical protein
MDAACEEDWESNMRGSPIRTAWMKTVVLGSNRGIQLDVTRVSWRDLSGVSVARLAVSTFALLA